MLLLQLIGIVPCIVVYTINLSAVVEGLLFSLLPNRDDWSLLVFDEKIPYHQMLTCKNTCYNAKRASQVITTLDTKKLN